MIIVFGYIADLLIGDPYWLFHPVRWIGNMINYLNRLLLKHDQSPEMQKIKGFLLLFCVSGTAFTVPFMILKILSPYKYVLLFVEAFMIFQILATRSLDVETKKVYKALKSKDIEQARVAISSLVSRDTDQMSEEDIIKASIETIAENLADGVVAPLCFLVLGGAPLGWFYKSVNTMDSMVGYKNDKYMHYGFAAAKFDDVLNWIPARLSALFIIVASFILRLDTGNSIAMMKRDRHNHASPNSAYPESAAAGALNIQLGGQATYFGKTSQKPTMGDKNKSLDISDLKKTSHLLYVTSAVALFSLMAMRIGVLYI